MSKVNLQELKEKLRELELIQQTLKKLPKTRKVLREVEGRLIEHNVAETLPAIQRGSLYKRKFDAFTMIL